jgi:hypothetical protein
MVPGSIPNIILDVFCCNGVLNYFVADLRHRKNIKNILNYVVGPVVFCIVVFSIYQQIQRQPNWKESFSHIAINFGWQSFFKILLVIALMFLNWGIEARKWQLSLDHVQKIGLGRAFKGVLTGNTLALFTPNRVGEYVGRIIYVNEDNRLKAMPVTFVCSIAQIIVTLVAGLIGLKFLRTDSAKLGFNLNWFDPIWYMIAGAALITLLIYFRLSVTVRWFEKLPFLKNLKQYLDVLMEFKATILFRILSLSTGRYLVFILQYYLLFTVFGVDISIWQSLWAVSVVFLALAIIPSIAVFTDLGIRWKTSIELVTVYSSNTVGILATSLAIWMINLVIPALIGSLLILSVKLFNDKSKD